MATTWVALFRNLNHGHRGSPTGAELAEAFGGAGVAGTFQTNGTVVFDAADAAGVMAAARERLRSAGFAHHVVVRSALDIRDAVAAAPHVDPEERVYRSMVSFFDGGDLRDHRPPLSSSNGLVEVRRLAPGVAHSVCWQRGSSAGDVTGHLERILGVPVTTRTLATLERLHRSVAVAHERGAD